MTPSDCTCVIVTTGTRDISEVLQSVQQFGEVIVWNNRSKTNDAKVYGRYLAAADAQVEWVYFLDDDTIPDHAGICAQAEPGRVVCNMPLRFRPHYASTGGISLVGFGCVFQRELLWEGFRTYDAAGFQHDEVFLLECDRVWTYGHRAITEWVDIPMRQLSYSSEADRMYRQRRTQADYVEIRRRLAML